MSSEGEPSQEEESTTIDQESEEEEEEEPVYKKVIKTSKTVKDDYKKMVKILQKQTGIKDKDLEGMTAKEAFDKLSFLAEHSQPKKNRKIVPENPSGIGTQPIEGISIIDNPVTGRKSFVIDPKKVFQK